MADEKDKQTPPPQEGDPKGEGDNGGDNQTSGGVNLQRVGEVLRDLPEAVKTMDLDTLNDLIPTLEKVIKEARARTPQGQESMQGQEGEPEENKGDFKDSAEIKDAVMQMANERVGIIMKAKNFLDESYDFLGADTLQIMRDALATQSAEEFKDEEVPVAFKLLKKKADYSHFADAQCEFDKIAEKEI